MVACQSANQLKTPAKVSWAFKMVSQFGSLGYTIMGKTADLTVVQKTIIDTLHKEGKPQTCICKEASCSQSAVSKHVNRKLSGRKKCGRKRWTTNRENRSLMRIVKQNWFKNLGELYKEWTEVKAVLLNHVSIVPPSTVHDRGPHHQAVLLHVSPPFCLCLIQCFFFPLLPMDPLAHLEYLPLLLEQGERLLNGHTTLFLVLASLTSYLDDALCAFYDASWSTANRALSSEYGPRVNFAAFVEWTLSALSQFCSQPSAQPTISSLRSVHAWAHRWRRAQTHHNWRAIAARSDRAEDRRGPRAALSVRPGARDRQSHPPWGRKPWPVRSRRVALPTATWSFFVALCYPYSQVQPRGGYRRGLPFLSLVQRGLLFSSPAQRETLFLSPVKRGFL